MTLAESIRKVAEDTAERIMCAAEEEKGINKGNLVLEIEDALSTVRQMPHTPIEIAALMERIKRDIDPHGIIFG